MESFEFLGGRYNRPEQIMSGPMQAFRAQNAATGRTVFIHRVSTTEAPEQQAALLKLLTTALVKSADAKRLVLDFGEESGYWYVVTESEPQCALLREWLQMEIDAAVVNSRLGLASDAAGHVATAPAAKPAPAPPAAPKEPATDTGEFTRFLQARAPFTTPPTASKISPPPPKPPSPALPQPPPPQKTEPSAGELTRVFPSPGKTPPPPELAASNPSASMQAPTEPPAVPPPQRPAPGEFTSFFNQAERPQFSSGIPQRPPVSGPAPPSAPPAPPSSTEPPAAGEFTRFFQGGLPPLPPKPAPSAPPALNFTDRTSNPYVQRPNTPVTLPPAVPPPPSQKPVEQGEFTQLFARPANAPPVLRPSGPSYSTTPAVRNDPFETPKDRVDDLFSDKINIPKPLPSSQPSQGEFTRIFGSGGDAAPPVQPPAVVAQPRESSLVQDDFRASQAPGAPRTPAINNEAGPSEFTRIMQGGFGSPKPPPEGNPAAGPAAAAKGGGALPPLNVNLPPINPAAAMPHMGGVHGSAGAAHANAGPSGASVTSAFGSAQMNVPHAAPPKLPIPSAAPAMPAVKVGGANKKMIILFGVLGVLAMLLVLLMLFLMKK